MINKGVSKIVIDYNNGQVHVFHGETNDLLCCYEESKDINTFKLIWNLLESYCDEFDGFRLGKPTKDKEHKENNIINLNQRRK